MDPSPKWFESRLRGLVAEVMFCGNAVCGLSGIQVSNIPARVWRERLFSGRYTATRRTTNCKKAGSNYTERRGPRRRDHWPLTGPVLGCAKTIVHRVARQLAREERNPKTNRQSGTPLTENRTQDTEPRRSRARMPERSCVAGHWHTCDRIRNSLQDALVHMLHTAYSIFPESDPSVVRRDVI